jgi:hypothetical protein
VAIASEQPPARIGEQVRSQQALRLFAGKQRQAAAPLGGIGKEPVTNRVEGNNAFVTATTTSRRGEPTLDAAPIIITEKEIVFSTAAAAPGRPTTIRGWSEATAVVLAAMQRLLLTSRTDRRRPRQDHPKRYEFLEHSCLAREMHRL